MKVRSTFRVASSASRQQTMSDDEDCDGMAGIFVYSSTYDADAFSIPSADELASQRKREVENNLKLKELRESHADDDDGHESIDSDGEEALAVAVSDMSATAGLVALRHAALYGASLRSVHDAPPAAVHDAPPATMHGAPPATMHGAPPARAMLAVLAPIVPTPTRDLFLNPYIAHRISEVVDSVNNMVTGRSQRWADDEVTALGVLLGAAALAVDAPRALALRTLHSLLQRCASTRQAGSTLGAMLEALPDARLRLELSDVLRTGGGAACRSLCALALDVALVALLSEGAAACLPLLQLLGRRLAEPPVERREREERVRLLALNQIAPDAQATERIKVLVQEAKLRLLFSIGK